MSKLQITEREFKDITDCALSYLSKKLLLQHREEAVQEAWLQAHKYFDSSKGNLKSFVIGLSVQKALDMRDEAIDANSIEYQEMIDPYSGELVDKIINLDLIQKSLDFVTPRQKQAIIERYFLEKTESEMGTNPLNSCKQGVYVLKRINWGDYT